MQRIAHTSIVHRVPAMAAERESSCAVTAIGISPSFRFRGTDASCSERALCNSCGGFGRMRSCFLPSCDLFVFTATLVRILVFDMPERKSFMYRQFDWGASRIKIPHSKKPPNLFSDRVGEPRCCKLQAYQMPRAILLLRHNRYCNAAKCADQVSLSKKSRLAKRPPKIRRPKRKIPDETAESYSAATFCGGSSAPESWISLTW